MLSSRKIQFIEEHSKQETSFCHVMNFNDLAIAQSEGARSRLKVGELFLNSVMVGNCFYYFGKREMVTTSFHYKQIFLDFDVDLRKLKLYLTLLKNEPGDFIYCFEKGEYVYDDCSK